METKRCYQCRYYIRHYGLREGRLYRLNCGHCTQGRARRRLPEKTACPLFVPGEPDEDAFVSKQYLSKKLLEHVLEISLLPEIREEDTRALK